jgi:hypothetical protein
MAAAACHNLLPGSDQFDNHALAVLMRHAPDLIQESVTFSAVML